MLDECMYVCMYVCVYMSDGLLVLAIVLVFVEPLVRWQSGVHSLWLG